MAFFRDDVAWGRLVHEGFSSFVHHLSAPQAEAPLVVLVSDGDLSRLIADLVSMCLAVTAERRVLSLAGGDLGRGLDAAGWPDRLNRDGDPPGLVIIEGLDRGGGPRRRQAAVALLDELAARRISACLTVSRRGFTTEFEPTLESRLAAGLVIHVPLRPVATASPGPTTSLARIVRDLARRYDMPPTLLTGPGRSRSAVEVRNLAMYLARRLTGRSFGSIGRAFGGRDHTTVMRGIRGVEERIASDASFATDVERLIEAAAGPSTPAKRRPTG